MLTGAIFWVNTTGILAVAAGATFCGGGGLEAWLDAVFGANGGRVAVVAPVFGRTPLGLLVTDGDAAAAFIAGTNLLAVAIAGE